MFVSCLCRVRQRDFTHYVYLCVCLHVRDMHAAARALSLFHSQGSGHFHALHACGSVGTLTQAARRHLGMSVCRRRRSAGLQRVRVCLVCCCSRSSRWSVSCGPAALRVCFVLSCCQRCIRTTWHGSAPPVSRCHARGGAGGAGFSLCSFELCGANFEASRRASAAARAAGEPVSCARVYSQDSRPAS